MLKRASEADLKIADVLRIVIVITTKETGEGWAREK